MTQKQLAAEVERRLMEKMDTCYHEAGHAVYCVTHDIPIVTASVVADDDSLGRVQTLIGSHHPLCTRLGLDAAGPEAARRAGFGFKPESAMGDVKSAMREIIEDLGVTDPACMAAYINSNFSPKVNRLDPWWPAVSAVAMKLFEHDELTGAQVKRIFAAAMARAKQRPAAPRKRTPVKHVECRIWKVSR